jgi:hypothetical protein
VLRLGLKNLNIAVGLNPFLCQYFRISTTDLYFENENEKGFQTLTV